MNKNELRFLLKEKYGFTEYEASGFNDLKIRIDEDLVKKINSRNKTKFKLPDIQNDIEALYTGHPLAYLIGHIEFLNSKIDLRYKPLIPRQETEYWTEEAIKTINYKFRDNSVIKCLDIFCGSGCIGISLLKNISSSVVTFADISGNAIKQTQYNLKENNIDKKRSIVAKSDIFLSIKEKFNVILANPPYVGIKDEVGKEIFYEPSIALYGGKDGLDVIKRFLNKVDSHIEKDGLLFMEFGDKQKDEISKILSQTNYKHIFKKDLYGKWRFVEVLF